MSTTAATTTAIVRLETSAIGRPDAATAWRTRKKSRTNVPVAMIAATLVENSRSAPSASPGASDSRVSPTTARGGTSEIAMATPGRVSDTSERTRANAPTTPVASAAVRSMSLGLTRPATWVLVAATTSLTCTTPMRYPMATTTRAPPTTRPALCSRWVRSASTRARAVPRIGVIRGATIMAPITVAVESATTPAEAMMAARISRTQNADHFRALSALAVM